MREWVEIEVGVFGPGCSTFQSLRLGAFLHWRHTSSRFTFSGSAHTPKFQQVNPGDHKGFLQLLVPFFSSFSKRTCFKPYVWKYSLLLNSSQFCYLNKPFVSWVTFYLRQSRHLDPNWELFRGDNIIGNGGSILNIPLSASINQLLGRDLCSEGP